jgi:hypothetical protein
VAACGILVLGYVRKRRRNRATLARWEHEDALHAAPDRDLGEDASAVPDAIRAASGLPKVEHEGGWHTVH